MSKLDHFNSLIRIRNSGLEFMDISECDCCVHIYLSPLSKPSVLRKFVSYRSGRPAGNCDLRAHSVSNHTSRADLPQREKTIGNCFIRLAAIVGRRESNSGRIAPIGRSLVRSMDSRLIVQAETNYGITRNRD